MLQLKSISKSYPNSERMIIDDLSFGIAENDSLAIVGQSGVGKSTLLNIMSTLDLPNIGDVFFENTNLVSLTANGKADFRNKKMGFVFQQHHLLPQLNVLENVLVPTLTIKDSSLKRSAEKRALDLLEQVGLMDLLKQKPGEMSVGECQRTAVVRALINKPKILFADEPTGSLDEESAEKLVDLLVQLNKQENMSLVMVTHAIHMANKLNAQYQLQKGKMLKL